MVALLGVNVRDQLSGFGDASHPSVPLIIASLLYTSRRGSIAGRFGEMPWSWIEAGTMAQPDPASTRCSPKSEVLLLCVRSVHGGRFVAAVGFVPRSKVITIE